MKHLLQLVGVLVALGTTVFSFTVTPHIFQSIWAWFVVPLGVPPLTHWQALGVMTAMSFPFLGQVAKRIADKTWDEPSDSAMTEAQRTDATIKRMSVSIVVCIGYLLSWGIAYVVAWIGGLA